MVLSGSWRARLVLAAAIVLSISVPTAAQASTARSARVHPPTAPTITTLAPSSGPVGTAVTITGTGFTGTTAVKFNGVTGIFKVKNATTITTSVPALAPSGPVTVTTGLGTATSPSPFTVTLGVSLTTTFGPPTTVVTVQGSGFGPNEGVDVFFDTSDVALFGTNANGNFGNVSVTVPASAVPGTHWISVEGRRTKTFAQASFLVRTDWPQRGFSKTRRGTNPYENVLSPTTVSGIDRDWAYATAGLVTSSPAVVNGVVYVGSTDSQVHAIDAATGRLDWVFATGGTVQSSPAVANGVVYVGSDDDNVYALNATTECSTGRSRRAGPSIRHRWSRTASSMSDPMMAWSMR